MGNIQKGTPGTQKTPDPGKKKGLEEKTEELSLLERIEQMISALMANVNAYKADVTHLAEKADQIAKEGEPTQTQKEELIDIEKALSSPTQLTLEDIEKLKATAAGGASGSSMESSPAIIFGGHLGAVDSLPRDLGIGTYTRAVDELITPPATIQTVTITPPDNPVSITDLLPQAEGGDALVNEANLLASRGASESEGSAISKGPTTVAGDFRISAPDGVSTLQVGGVAVITNGVFSSKAMVTPLGNILNIISYDAASGVIVYHYTLMDNEQHALEQGTNSLFDNLPVFLSDLDGDSATDTLIVNIVDDVPSIIVSEENANLVVDESELSQNAVGDFSGLFTSIPGADGATITYALGISQGGSESGLVDTATHASILLYVESGTVVGRVGGSSGEVAFTIAINGSTGEVTLDQVRAIEHSDASDPDDAAGLASGDLIFIQATITDADGDTASVSRNIADSFSFEDDGPSVNVSAVASADMMTVDETSLATNATADFSDNFASTSSYGADSAGSLSTGYALSVSASGANSGLTDVATGQSILLYMNGGVVEGRTSGSNAVVFTVSVDGSGMVTLDQLRAITHPDTGNPDDAVTLGSADLIQLTRTDTIVDRDGDSAVSAADINIGQALFFEDDGPSVNVSAVASADMMTVDETSLATNATADFSDNFASTSSYGADSAGSLSTGYALSVSASGANSGLTDVATGQSILLYMNGGVVEGRTSGSNAVVFTVSVDGGGMVTLDQLRAITHPDTGNPDDAVTLGSADLIQLTRTDTIVDRDGDSAVSAANINIGQALSFEDDGPSVDVSVVASADMMTVDETNLATNATADFSDNFASTSSYGADSAGSLSTGYALSVSASGANSGLTDVATGQSILLYMNGGVVEGRTSGSNAVVFTVSVDGSGMVTLDQLRAITHPDTGNPDDAVTLGSADLIQLTRTDTIVDRDGDSAVSAANINIGQALSFEDDGPSVDVSVVASADMMTVDETNLATNATADFSDNFASTSSYGADSAGSLSTGYALSVSVSGANSGLTDVATGQSILLYMNGGVVEGRTSGSNAVVFTVSVDGSGMVTLDQLRAITHPDTGNPDDAVTLGSADLIQLTRTDTIVDRDGDSAVSAANINIGQALSFEDDGPSVDVSVVASADMMTVDETNLATNATADFADNFSTSSNYGEDGAGSVASSYTLSVSGSGANSGLTDVATGQSVLLYMNGNVVEGRTSGSNVLVFTLAVSAAGMVTLDQMRAIAHPDPLNPDDSMTLSSSTLVKLTRTDVVTDRDGDTATGSATINIGQAMVFRDDGPSLSNVNDPDADQIIELSAFNPASNTAYSAQMVNWIFGADSGVTPVFESTKGSMVFQGISPDQAQIQFYDTNGDLAATLTVDSSGTESLQVVHRDNLIQEDTLLTGEAKAGGPGIYFVDSSISPSLTIRVTADDGNVKTANAVNPSNQGWAVDNNVISVNEVIKFESLDKTTLTPTALNNFSFSPTGFTGGHSSYAIQVTVRYSDNTTETFSLNVTEGQTVNVADLVGFNTGSLIYAVEVTNTDTTVGSNNGFRLNNVTIFSRSESPPPDLDYAFNLKLVDADGDSVSQAFTVHLDGDPQTGLSGYSIDGPIVGASVFQDLNLSGVLDSGEAYSISDQSGAYNLSIFDTNLDGAMDYLDGRMISVGGTDSETGLSYEIPMYAPVGSEVVSPLTSIFQMQVESDDAGNVDGTMARLVDALGLEEGTDLTSLNPIAAAEDGDIAALSQAAGIMTLSIQLSAACEGMLGESSGQYAAQIYKAIGDQLLQLPEGTHADFSNGDLLHSIVGDLGHQLGVESSRFEPIMDVLTSSQEALQNSVANLPEGADAVDAISAVQQLTQGVYAESITSYYTSHAADDGTALSLQDVGLQSGSVIEPAGESSTTTATEPAPGASEPAPASSPTQPLEQILPPPTEE